MNAPAKVSIVNVHEAKTHLSRLLDRVHAGEEIILAKAGVPWAKLVPIAPEPRKPRQPGRFKHLLGKIDNDQVVAPIPVDEWADWDRKFDDI